MMFRKRLEQAMALLKEKRAQRGQGGDEPYQLEKGDLKAMIIAALIVFIPVALLVLVLMVLAGAIWFWR